jgi:serine protease Do
LTCVRAIRIIGWFFLSVSAALCQVPSGGTYLGLILRDLTMERVQELKLDRQRGAEVVGVEEDGPAARAGVQVNDVILTYNGEEIVGKLQLGRLVAETPTGRRITLRVWRNGKAQTVSLVTIARPEQTQSAVPVFPFAVDIPVSLLIWRNQILGVVCEAVPPQMTTFFGVSRGVLVRYVDKGALGDTSGLKAGDIVLASTDRIIANPRDLTAALVSDSGSLRPAKFSVLREHKRISIDVHPPD